ncbi:MAG: L-threonylcarbamoyladenylate synthase [Candidatus Aminicenantes bacterium]|nr:L-threonylcarbamoyladenylate synthase [Candidatus Aminicenantes bacterium]
MDYILQTEEALDKASTILRQGGVVAFPTETVYGLGADVFNSLAVARVFEIKARPHFDPLIVHIACMDDLLRLAQKIPDKALNLAKKFWPGPLTLVLLKKEIVPDIVTSGLPSVAIRMPRHNLALRLILKTERPIVGPSANPFGYLSPTTAHHVRDQLGSKIDFILDGGPCEVGLESTIISFLEDPPRLLRPGGIPLEDIESTIGPINSTPLVKLKPEAPGLLPRHYAPRTRAYLDWSEADFWRWKEEGKKIGLLSFRGEKTNLPFDHLEILSPEGDLRQAAAALFASLHRLDKAKLDLILIEKIPEIGLGRAIMDRLRRATFLSSDNPFPSFSESP